MNKIEKWKIFIVVAMLYIKTHEVNEKQIEIKSEN